MIAPFISWVLNNPIMTFLGSQLVDKKLTTIAKTLWAPFNIQRLKVHVVDKNLAKANCTYTIKVYFINVKRTFSIKTFLHGKFTLGHNQRTNMWNQTFSLVLNDKIPLVTNNMISLVPFYVLWSFRNGFKEEEKSCYGIHGFILPFSNWFLIMKSLGMNMYII